MAVKSLVRSGVDNFEKYSSLLAGNIGYDTYFEHITTTTLDSAVASVTFSDLDELAGTYQHLQIRATLRSTRSSTISYFINQLNGDTGNNYAGHYLYGESGSVGSSAETSTSRIFGGIMPANNDTANAFGAAVIDILDPYETKNKTIRILTGHATSGIRLASGVWLNTSSLTSFTLLGLYGDSFAQYCRFSLYGLR